MILFVINVIIKYYFFWKGELGFGSCGRYIFLGGGMWSLWGRGGVGFRFELFRCVFYCMDLVLVKLGKLRWGVDFLGIVYFNL